MASEIFNVSYYIFKILYRVFLRQQLLISAVDSC
jgi:hypothetical protein